MRAPLHHGRRADDGAVDRPSTLPPGRPRPGRTARRGRSRPRRPSPPRSRRAGVARVRSDADENPALDRERLRRLRVARVAVEDEPELARARRAEPASATANGRSRSRPSSPPRGRPRARPPGGAPARARRRRLVAHHGRGGVHDDGPLRQGDRARRRVERELHGGPRRVDRQLRVRPRDEPVAGPGEARGREPWHRGARRRARRTSRRVGREHGGPVRGAGEGRGIDAARPDRQRCAVVRGEAHVDERSADRSVDVVQERTRNGDVPLARVARASKRAAPWTWRWGAAASAATATLATTRPSRRMSGPDGLAARRVEASRAAPTFTASQRGRTQGTATLVQPLRDSLGIPWRRTERDVDRGCRLERGVAGPLSSQAASRRGLVRLLALSLTLALAFVWPQRAVRADNRTAFLITRLKSDDSASAARPRSSSAGPTRGRRPAPLRRAERRERLRAERSGRGAEAPRSPVGRAVSPRPPGGRDERGRPHADAAEPRRAERVGRRWRRRRRRCRREPGERPGREVLHRALKNHEQHRPAPTPTSTRSSSAPSRPSSPRSESRRSPRRARRRTAARGVISSRHLKGYYLSIVVDAFDYSGGDLRVKVKLAVFTYPGKDLRGEVPVSPGAVGRTAGDTHEDNLMGLAAGRARRAVRSKLP